MRYLMLYFCQVSEARSAEEAQCLKITQNVELKIPIQTIFWNFCTSANSILISFVFKKMKY